MVKYMHNIIWKHSIKGLTNNCVHFKEFYIFKEKSSSFIKDSMFLLCVVATIF